MLSTNKAHALQENYSDWTCASVDQLLGRDTGRVFSDELVAIASGAKSPEHAAQAIVTSKSRGRLCQIIRSDNITLPQGKEKTYARDQTTAGPMIKSRRKIALNAGIALLVAGLLPYTLNSAEMSATTTGETVAGFNKPRLEQLHDGLRRFVDSGEYAGTISLLLRGGQVADVYVYGMQDIENKIPMGRDTICRMYSQSKIITTIPALILVEEGKLDFG